MVLYSNYNSLEKEDEVRESLFYDYAEEYNWISTYDVPDYMVDNAIDGIDEADFEEVKNYLSDLISNSHCLMLGTIETWNGSKKGGQFIDSFNDLLKTISFLDNIEIKEENRHLLIRGSHHDGNAEFEIKRLTNKGYNLALKNHFIKDRKLHEKLFYDSNYTRLGIPA